MSEFEQNIFGKKTLSGLFKDIYDNSVRTESQISELIGSLKPFIKTSGDAVMIVPLIKEYLEVKVKNDEHLVKMAAIVQRAAASTNKASANVDEFGLSETEKEQLLLEINAIGDEQDKIKSKTKKLLTNKNENQ